VKANHSKVGEEIAMRWNDGVYELDNGDSAVENLINSKTDAPFLELLALFNAQNQYVSSKSGANYAPAKMESHPKAKGFTKRQLAGSMQRLMDAKRVRLVIEDSKSRQRTRLIVSDPATAH
jgi:hypothetical protein